MDSISTSSLQESNSLNYFPSAVLESPSTEASQVIESPALCSFQPPKSTKDSLSKEIGLQLKTKTSVTDNMTVVLSIGPSKEPVPLLRYEFYNSSSHEQIIYDELIMRSKSIQTMFSDLVLNVCSILLESSEICIERLQLWLSFQNCTKSAQGLQAFDKESDAFKTKTIPAFISSLHCYSSWYNYHLIASIAEKFCGSKGSALMITYESELKKFFQSLILHCPPLFPDGEDFTHDVNLLEVKIKGWQASTALLEDISLFKHALCKLCNLDHRFLVIRKIDANDFKMVWAVPRTAIDKIRKSIKQNSDFKSDLRAIKIRDFEVDLQKVAYWPNIM